MREQRERTASAHHRRTMMMNQTEIQPEDTHADPSGQSERQKNRTHFIAHGRPRLVLGDRTVLVCSREAPIRPHPVGQVCESFCDFSVWVEKKEFCHHSSHTSVVDYEAFGIHQSRVHLKVQCGYVLKSFGPIRGDCCFTFQNSRRLSCDCGDRGRGHFEVVCVMGKNAFEIVAILGVNPFLREVIRELACNHKPPH